MLCTPVILIELPCWATLQITWVFFQQHVWAACTYAIQASPFSGFRSSLLAEARKSAIYTITARQKGSLSNGTREESCSARGEVLTSMWSTTGAQKTPIDQWSYNPTISGYRRLRNTSRSLSSNSCRAYLLNLLQGEAESFPSDWSRSILDYEE